MKNILSNAAIYELGEFSWLNEFEPKSQKGWELNQEIRGKIADGSIKFFVMALNADRIQKIGILGGIEIMFNYDTSGQKQHDKAFPWNWDKTTEKGGWITYRDLLNERCVKLDSGVIYLEYNLTFILFINLFKKR